MLSGRGAYLVFYPFNFNPLPGALYRESYAGYHKAGIICREPYAGYQMPDTKYRVQYTGSHMPPLRAHIISPAAGQGTVS